MEQKENKKSTEVWNLDQSPKSTYVTSGHNVTSQGSGQGGGRNAREKPSCEALLPLLGLSRCPQGLASSGALPEVLYCSILPALEILGSLLFDLAILERGAVVPFAIPSKDDHGPFVRDEHLDDANS